jgi:hypothetical protein
MGDDFLDGEVALIVNRSAILGRVLSLADSLLHVTHVALDEFRKWESIQGIDDAEIHENQSYVTL